MGFEDFTSAELELISSGVRLRRPSNHTSIFKYVGLNTKTSWDSLEATLNQLTLTGSTATSLNDPFELSPYIFDDLRPRIVAAALRDTGSLESLRNGKFEPDKKYGNLDPYRTQAKDYLAKVERNSRIISFCERSDSPLLWSHYAHSYAGACLHFLGRAFRSSRAQMGYVSYSKYRPTYPLSLALTLAANSSGKPPISSMELRRAESEKLYFFTKAADWEYETEVRIVYNTVRMKSVTFDEDGLAAIILGPRMSDENRERIRKIIGASKVPNLPVRDAKLSTNSFSVEID
ncbi:hypothetical protein LZ496_10185 [Sphingomonas sp. NSE70-1]|uniref:DUF2971 domain-containing protein n=1 Tax=Sphingomonas caseinilyticus TaxID=2908205 RepID=A0ABT0RVX3_9SPHN|nr:DUF2971 domain-containing protein [Sphingomonas caseinilyticus]MCL6699145.1 hypothetical protein [Sphingomonas caseinilyticus]